MPRTRFYLLAALAFVAVGVGSWSIRKLLLGLPPMAALEDYALVARDHLRLRRERQRRGRTVHREARASPFIEDSGGPAKRGDGRRIREFHAPLGHFPQGHDSLGAAAHLPELDREVPTLESTYGQRDSTQARQGS